MRLLCRTRQQAEPISHRIPQNLGGERRRTMTIRAARFVLKKTRNLAWRKSPTV